MTISRRTILGAIAFAPFVAAANANASSGANTCYDPSSLPASQRSRRRALGFRDAAAGSEKRCGECAFFKASGDKGCGTCDLLTGGMVTADNVCNSWAKKP